MQEFLVVMQEFLAQIVALVNTYLWDRMFLLVLLVGTGLYYTFLLNFVQVRKFKEGFKKMFSGFSLGARSEEGLTSFQALTTAIAAQVGTGNIAGAATAIYHGGAGAIFWMWVSAFFGMSTIFAEAVLAQKTKILKDGHYQGGPVYYINYIFKDSAFAKFLSTFFSVAIILALGFMGNMVQSNSISNSFVNAFGGNQLVIGVVVGVLSGLIFIGGIKRIAWVTEKVVPFMALLYIAGCIIIVIKFSHQIIPTFQSIFISAFSTDAVIGGAMGVGIKKAMRYGVARGLFSNEAGMGSTPHAHAAAIVKNPSEQGIIAMMGVFIDTFIILTLTALIILTTGALASGEQGAALAQIAFIKGFGNEGTVFIAICMFFFAFTTIIGWYYFAEVNVRYLLGNSYIKPFAILVVIFVILGSTLKVQLVWDMADMFNGFMVIPNLIALIFAGKVVKSIMNEDESL